MSANLMKNLAKKSRKNFLELCLTHQVSFSMLVNLWRLPFTPSEETKVNLKIKNCGSVMIPGNPNSYLEFLDIVLNKPFKNYLWKECEAWSLSETLSLAPYGKIEGRLLHKRRVALSRLEEDRRKTQWYSHSRTAALRS
jgi:hypothetical protein